VFWEVPGVLGSSWDDQGSSRCFWEVRRVVWEVPGVFGKSPWCFIKMPHFGIKKTHFAIEYLRLKAKLADFRLMFHREPAEIYSRSSEPAVIRSRRVAAAEI